MAEALGAVAQSGDADAAEALEDRLYDYGVTLDQWRADFQSYFGEGAYTLTLGQFWEAVIGAADEREQPRLALISALCAADAVKAALPHAAGLPAARDSLMTAFRWLQYASPALDTPGRASAFAALSKAMAGHSLETFAQDPLQYAFYVQAALTLADYADAGGRGTLEQMLSLPPSAAAMWRMHGVLVFDRGAFGEAHYASLASLLSAVPRQLHAIRAIVVPDVAESIAGATFATPGQIVQLPPISMDVYTSPDEFITTDQPVAPQFTAIAAQEIVRAVQAVQFWKRPDLAARRDIVLASARGEGARYLRSYRAVAPDTYAADPDDLLPALAYIYVIDSRTVFDMALGLFQLSKVEAIDQFLLLTDLMSGGGTSAPLFATSIEGEVASEPATIGRVHGSWVRPAASARTYSLNADVAAPVDLWFCNAIAYRNSRYVFEFDDQGIAARYLR